MKDILFSVSALDASNTAQTLRFSLGRYIDDDANPYATRIRKPALVTVAPNDGGLLSIFAQASIGDIELVNTDGGLNYLADWAVDGRSASVSVVEDDGTVVTRFHGTVGRMTESGGNVVFNLKALQETLNNPHPMAAYAGDNVAPSGLEGTADTIGGDVKPKVFGDVRNITPVLVNAPLQIYQVSSRDDCRITAVYDEGVGLFNFRVNGSHSIGATSISVDTGLGDIPAGAEIVFGNHSTIYTVDVGLAEGVIVLVSGLSVAVPDNSVIAQVNFFADTSALQYTDYFVDGDHAAGVDTVAITGGSGSIDAGDMVAFGDGQQYQSVATGLIGGVIVLDDGLVDDLNDGDVVHVLGASNPMLWGSYQGYFRLVGKPAGAITCDAISINGSGQVHKGGDAFELVATEAGFTLDSAGVTEFNSAGVLGLAVTSSTTTLDLFNKIAASVAGYYHFVDDVIYLNLLTAPAGTPDWVLYDYQLDKPTRSATGLGKNGVPIYSVRTRYDRIETVQDTVGGEVSSGRRQRLKSEYRELVGSDPAVLTRHPLSERLEVESLLRFSGNVSALNSRLLPIVKVRRDVVSVVVARDQVQSYVIGGTGLIYCNKLGYSSGRLMVLSGYEIDDGEGMVTLYLYG